MITKDKITEEEIIRAIRQVGEDAEIIEAFKSVSEQELREILEKERHKPETKIFPEVAPSHPLSVLVHPASEARSQVTSRRPAKTMKRWLIAVASIAAVFLVILLLKYLYTPSGLETSYQTLYTTSFEMPKGLVPRSKSDFFDLYNKGLYKEALSVQETNRYFVFNKQDYELKFYVSVCYMYNEDFQKAIQYLSELHKAVPDWQKVQWYLALCYLNQKEADKAKELLQNINNEEYADKAKEILKKLE